MDNLDERGRNPDEDGLGDDNDSDEKVLDDDLELDS